MGSDWALDIAASGGTSIVFATDWGGYGTGANPAPDMSRDINIYGHVAAHGNLRNDPTNHPACNWQKIDVLATYYGANGTLYSRLAIGEIWYLHGTFSKADGTDLPPTNSYQNPYGSGRIYYVAPTTIGTVYSWADSGSSPCSTGAHLHQEVLSNHAWGFEYEWHSSGGPDGFSPAGGLYGISNHVHWGKTASSDGVNYSGSDTVDSVSQGQVLGDIGGGTTAFWIADNPWASYH